MREKIRIKLIKYCISFSDYFRPQFSLGILELVIESNFAFRASLNTFFAPPSPTSPFSQKRGKIARKQSLMDRSCFRWGLSRVYDEMESFKDSE